MNETHEVRGLDRLERTVRDASSIGKTWARYSLGVSKSALLTSAETLQKMAGMLDDLSGQFADARTEREATAKPPAPAVEPSTAPQQQDATSSPPSDSAV